MITCLNGFVISCILNQSPAVTLTHSHDLTATLSTHLPHSGVLPPAVSVPATTLQTPPVLRVL